MIYINHAMSSKQVLNWISGLNSHRLWHHSHGKVLVVYNALSPMSLQSVHLPLLASPKGYESVKTAPAAGRTMVIHLRIANTFRMQTSYTRPQPYLTLITFTHKTIQSMHHAKLAIFTRVLQF